MHYLDAIYLSITSIIFVWCVARNSYSTSYKVISIVLFIEIFTIYLSSKFILHTGIDYKFWAAMHILCLLSLAPLQGGGVVKIGILVLYGLMMVTHYIFANFYSGVVRPYLDIITVLSYVQLLVVLFAPKIESLSIYDKISRSLIGNSVLGFGLGYYICNNFDGSPTIYQRKKK